MVEVQEAEEEVEAEEAAEATVGETAEAARGAETEGVGLEHPLRKWIDRLSGHRPRSDSKNATCVLRPIESKDGFGFCVG